MNSRALENICRELLIQIGEDPSREGLRLTPERFSRSMAELTCGYNQSIAEITRDAVFPCENSEMILVREVSFYSMCEHHLLPFFGTVNVAYIPDGKIIGLSKVSRIINMFARRLQVQENLTNQIASELDSLLSPAGVACTIEASHLCMLMRGVQAQSGKMITNSMRGAFLQKQALRDEFFCLLGKK